MKLIVSASTLLRSLAFELALAMPAIASAQTTNAREIQTWTPRARAEVLSQAERVLGSYIYADKLAALRAAIEKNKQAFIQIDDQRIFAQTLTRELQAAAHDRHIIVWYSETSNAPNSQPTREQIAATNRFFQYVDYGYNGSARLAGNIGYVAFGGFADLPKAKSTIDAAMCLMSPTQALIVDMRGNAGGDSDTVNYLLGYFFSERVEVTTAIQRTSGGFVKHRNFTPLELGGPRYSNKPVYVLVDRGTISGGELFVYDLKSLHRVTVVGEITAGAANGLGAPPHYLSAHLSMSVPDTMLRNPYTGTNWEGVGVKPDVTVDARTALLTAYERALGAINASYDPVGELEQARKDPAAALSKSSPQI